MPGNQIKGYTSLESDSGWMEAEENLNYEVIKDLEDLKRT